MEIPYRIVSETADSTTAVFYDMPEDDSGGDEISIYFCVSSGAGVLCARQINSVKTHPRYSLPVIKVNMRGQIRKAQQHSL